MIGWVIKRKIKRYIAKNLNVVLAGAGIVLLSFVLINAFVIPGTAETIDATDSRKEVLTPIKTGVRVTEEIVLEHGDSVWSIAEEYLDRTYFDNARDFVNQIASVNNLKNANKIQLGDTLLIPCYEWDK